MTENVCKEHSGVCANMSNLQKQVDVHSNEIKTVGEAVIKLTTLLEEIAKHKKDTTKRPFWDTETKKFTIRLLFIFIVLGMFLIAGLNVMDSIPALGTIK